jgi:hypothetical protein
MLQKQVGMRAAPGEVLNSLSTQLPESRMPSNTSNRTTTAIAVARMLPEQSFPAQQRGA